MRAERYLTPEGVGHYLVGCDDDAARERCLAATRLALPKRIKQLVADRNCADARMLAEFADRNNVSSPALRSALGVCKNR